MNTIKRLFLVRHGTSEGNVNKQVYFTTRDCDVKLTPKGQEDAANAADKIHELVKGVGRFSLYHSSYKRARQTADIIYDRLCDTGYEVGEIRHSPLAREREWGNLRDVIEENLNHEHFHFYYRPIGGESFADVYQRVAIFHDWMLKTHKFDDVIIVAHGEFNKVYLMFLLGLNEEEFENYANQKNGEVWEVDLTQLGNSISVNTPLRESSYIKRIQKRLSQVIKTEQ